MINIKAILIFGSTATGREDEMSDIDICLIKSGDFDLKKLEKFIEGKIKILNNSAFELVEYTEVEFDLMLRKGSLFLHHLKDEGLILLGEKFLKKKFNKLEKFDSFEDELTYYHDIYLELLDSKIKIQSDENFDYSLAFTLIRNICILLSVFNKNPKFGRKNAFEYCLKTYNNEFPISSELFDYLELIKLKYERGIDVLIQEKNSFKIVDNSIRRLFKLANDEFK